MSNIITRNYNNVPFVFREDGYFNMTKAAAHFRKRLDHFFSNQETEEYIESLTAITGIPGNALIQAKRGGAPGQAGTWAHPKLAVFFARWLDVRFAVWCDSVIEDILTKKAELTITQPGTSAALQSPCSPFPTSPSTPTPSALWSSTGNRGSLLPT